MQSRIHASARYVRYVVDVIQSEAILLQRFQPWSRPATALAQPADKSAADSPHSTGCNVSPETKGQQQPQARPVPFQTTAGGAPAESLQG